GRVAVAGGAVVGGGRSGRSDQCGVPPDDPADVCAGRLPGSPPRNFHGRGGRRAAPGRPARRGERGADRANRGLGQRRHGRGGGGGRDRAGISVTAPLHVAVPDPLGSPEAKRPDPVPAPWGGGMRGPSGEQWTIKSADHEAVVVEVGGGLRTYRAHGVDVVDGYAEHEMCPASAGQVLAPWP